MKTNNLKFTILGIGNDKPGDDITWGQLIQVRRYVETIIGVATNPQNSLTISIVSFIMTLFALFNLVYHVKYTHIYNSE